MLGPPCAWWSGRTEFRPRQAAGELRSDVWGRGALRSLLGPEHSQSDRWSCPLPAHRDLEGGRGPSRGQSRSSGSCRPSLPHPARPGRASAGEAGLTCTELAQ